MGRRAESLRQSSSNGLQRGWNFFSSVRRWGYSAATDSGRGRDLRLDMLRGFAVFAMVADHIGGESSWLYAVTGGDRFFVSAAELFVVVSGVTMGIVYGGILGRDGTRAALSKVLGRAYLLYVLTVSLTLATATVALALSLPWAPPLSQATAGEFVAGVIALQRTYYLTDVLLLYTFLVLVAGLALAAIARGGTWLVLAASWSVWLFWQFSPGRAQFPWPIRDNTAFPLAAWQLYFFTALAVGIHRRSIARRVQRLHPVLTLVVSGVFAAGLVALHLYLTHAPAAQAETDYTWSIAGLFYKYDVRVGRVAAMLVFTVFAYALLSMAWGPLQRGLGWLLLPLGQHALTAYALHLFMVPLASAAGGVRPNGVPSLHENTFTQLTGVIAIWLIIVVRPRAARLVRDAVSRSRRLSIPSTRRRQPVFINTFGVLFAAPAVLALTRFRAVQGLLAIAVSLGIALGSARVWAPATILPEDADVPAAQSLTDPAVVVRMDESGRAVAAFAIHKSDAPTATGSRLEGIFHSAALGRDMPYIVYLPAGYDRSGTARYPTLFMLHGMGGHNTEWEQYGLLESADRLIAAGEIEPLIIVLPQGDQSYWVDWADAGPSWGLYTARDVVQHIDAQFRTIARPSGRAIGGLSMGAHGAMQVALSYPGVFGVVGAHSPSLRSFDERLPYFGDSAYFNAHDPLHLVYAHPEVARSLQIWIDVGDDDMWHDSIAQLEAALERSAVQHIWRIYAGAHDSEYWSAHTDDYLHFYARALRLPHSAVAMASQQSQTALAQF